MTYLVSINYAGQETDRYVVAKNEVEAIAIVRKSLPAQIRHWANVFVG